MGTGLSLEADFMLSQSFSVMALISVSNAFSVFALSATLNSLVFLLCAS